MKWERTLEPIEAEIERAKQPLTTARSIAAFLTLLVLLFFSLFAPPVSWKEIFFVSTLKQIASGLLLVFDSALKITDIEGLQLSFAFHEPPWFLETVTPLNRVLLSFLPAECGLQFGGCAVLSVRLIAFGIALFSFFAVRLALRRRGSTDSSSISKDSFSLTAFFIYSAAALLFLVRIGAIEQLFVASALPLLFLFKKTPSETQRFLKTLFLLSAISLLFALSGSRLWLTTTALSGLLLSGLQYGEQASITRKSLGVGLLFVALCYTGLFLFSGSYMGLVHHLTLRWLNEIHMHNIDLGWSGSSLVWKGVSLWLMSLSLKKLFTPRSDPAATCTSATFAHLLVTVSGMVIALAQRNPAVEDVALQFFIFSWIQMASPIHVDPKEKSSPTYRNVWATWLAKNGTDKAPQFVALSIATALALAAVLSVLPSTTVVPEMKAWLSALSSLSQFKISEFLPVIFLMTVLLFFFVIEFANQRPTTSAFSPLVFLGILFLGSELRAALLWQPLDDILARTHKEDVLYFPPPIEPLLRVAAPPNRLQMVSVTQAEVEKPEGDHSIVFIVPRFASDLCHAMDWNIERKHGIFTLCTLTHDSKWKLTPLN